MAYAPCLNPNCSSQGRSHPNCHCYDKRPVPAGMEAPGTTVRMAEGGEAKKPSPCSGPHDAKCEYHIPSDTSEVFHNAVAHHGLSNLIKQTSKTDLDTDKNPHRAFDSYIQASRKGAKKYDNVVKTSLDSDKHDLRADPEQLQKQLDGFKQKPETAFEVGSGVGNISPDHSVDLAGAVGSAGSYLQSIKPAPTNAGPLSNPLPVNSGEKQAYERQVHITEQPLSVVERVRNGSLLPQDVQTLSTVYPKLYNKLKTSIMESVVDKKGSNADIPYNIRSSLSLFLGQPMDAAQFQPIAAAAMLANAPKTPPAPPSSKKPSKPTNAQMQKSAGMYATNTQKNESPDQS